MKEITILKRLKGIPTVINMTSNRGNKVANQFVINYDNGYLFKSYNSIIAVKYKGKTYLGEDWDYSRTTGKYRNDFLGENKASTELKIKSGVYTLLTY